MDQTLYRALVQDGLPPKVARRLAGVLHSLGQSAGSSGDETLSSPVVSVNGRSGQVAGLAEVDLRNVTPATGRAALGLASAATQPASAFDAAGAAAAAVADLVNGAPAALDTLGEIAAALQADETAEAALTNAVAGKAQATFRTSVKTANYTAAAGQLVPVDTATPNANITVTLPSAPAVGSRVTVKHIAVGTGKSVTVACAGSDVFNKAAGSTTVSLTLLNQAVTVQYDAGIWTVVSDDLPLSALSGAYVALVGDNDYKGSQHFFPRSGVAPTVLAAIGGQAGWSWGIDGASPDRAGSDFFLGPTEVYPAADNLDIFYIQRNGANTTLAAPVAAGATALTLAAALTLNTAGPDGKFYVWIGDDTDMTVVETVSVTAGSGTTTLTCAATAHAHPSGARVTVMYDRANQPTIEFYRVGSAYATNAKWRVTMRPSQNATQPDLGVLKLEIPPAGGQTADYLLVGSRDETQKAFRVMYDYTVSIENSVTDHTDTAAASTSGSAVVQVSVQQTVKDSWLGRYVSGSTLGVPSGAYILAVDTVNNRITMSANATATTTATLTVKKPRVQVRKDASGSYAPVWSMHGSDSVLRTKLGVGATSPIPTYDLDVKGTDIRVTSGGAAPDWRLNLDDTGSGTATLWAGGGKVIAAQRISSATRIGFFGVTPAVQQTLPASGTVTAADIRTALINLGLCV